MNPTDDSSSAPQPLIASEVGLTIRSLEDIADAVGRTFVSSGLLLEVGDVAPAFFDLRSGLAGELFQKFTNYRLRLALVLPDPAAHGPRWPELAFEHRAHPLIRFFGSSAEARAWLEG